MMGIGKGIPRPEETKEKISAALLGIKRPETLKPNAQKIEVLDLETKKSTIFPSISEAERALSIGKVISRPRYFRNNQQNPYKNKYIFKTK
jgi:hypothetical protein